MAKFSGNVGYCIVKQTSPGIYEEEITEKKYYGDIFKNTRGLQQSNQVNDNITISNEISIISDSFAIRNFGYIRYVTLKGIKWKVTNVSIQYPRLVLTVGGVYNGQ